MVEYWKKCLNKYADFNGRARRSEYWYFGLMNFLIVLGAYAIAIALAFVTRSAIISIIMLVVIGLYSLATIIPNLAVLVRRLHDTGKSGAWFFISFVPLIGGIWLLVLMCTDSQPGANDYGTNPKEINTDLSK